MKEPGQAAYVQYEKKPEVKGLQYLEQIRDAIEKQKVLRLYYLPFYEDKPYFIEVHPYILKQHASRWYLVALNDFKDQTRTYALDRIRDLQADEEKKYRTADFNISDYFRHSVGIMAPGGPPPLIRLAVQRTQAQYLITSPWHASQSIEEEDEQEVVFSFRVHPTYEFRSLVLSLGKDGRILEPEDLRSDILKELEAMLGSYRQD